MPAIVVVDPDPAWPRLFEQLRAALWPAVSDIAVGIEHVGSTSVPGLAAKPIIDIDVIVQPDRIAQAIARLVSIGYQHKGDLGVPGREAFVAPPDTPRHHLYACPVGNTALANHVAVRDYLRANPDAARAYGALKRELGVRFADDVDGYVEGKSAFILDILRKSGFGKADLMAIEAINRRPADQRAPAPSAE